MGSAENSSHDHSHSHSHAHERESGESYNAHHVGEEHGHSHGLRRDGDRRALWIAFVITALFMIAESIGGYLSGSLALMADAGHMLTDAAALGLSLAALWLARRPSTARKSYGLMRAEILAALVNGVTLWVICGLIYYNAYQRWNDPPPIQGGLMLAIAIAGLVANAATLGVLWKSGGTSLNLRGALLHVLGDMLGSVGAIGAAVIILNTGWTLADPIISVVIATMIVVGAYRLVAETVRVLLEIAPPHIDPAEVETALKEIPGVIEVHDLHLWTITSGVEAISGHLRLADDAVSSERMNEVLLQAHKILARYSIEHVTLQIEPRCYNGC